MTVAFEIEKGVPLPVGSSGARRYPLRDMLVGDSFAVPRPDHLTLSRHQAQLASTIWAFERRHPGFKFRTRQEGDGVRVWRVASVNLFDQNVPPPPERAARVHRLDDTKRSRAA